MHSSVRSAGRPQRPEKAVPHPLLHPTAASCNATRTTTVFGADFNALAVSYITTSCDFLYSLLFAAAMWWTHKRFLKFVTRIDDENITPSDYTVYVTHMPRDATEAEIRDHFSELFALQTADEGGADAAATTSDALRLQGPPSVASGGPSSGSARTLDHSLRGLGTGAPTLGSFLVQLPGTQVKPVEDTSNTQDPSCVGVAHAHATRSLTHPPIPLCPRYKGSWVADVGTVRPIGAALRIFLQAQAQFEALRQARAESKRVRSECERAGFDPETDSAAGADVAKAEKKVVGIDVPLASPHRCDCNAATPSPVACWRRAGRRELRGGPGGEGRPGPGACTGERVHRRLRHLQPPPVLPARCGKVRRLHVAVWTPVPAPAPAAARAETAARGACNGACTPNPPLSGRP